MISNTEDEDLFVPAVTSNLASLFGTTMKVTQDLSTNLTYTAPKQPKSGIQETQRIPPKSGSQSTVICSKFVDVFKIVEQAHISQGKCGLAIIGNEAVKSYDIIIYKSKQVIIMSTKLQTDFAFTIQSNNFAYICDGQKQQWSIHFENTQDIENFAYELTLRGGKVINAVTESALDSYITKPPQITKDKDSDSYSDNSTSKTKANILSRMAKMGQSILPTNLSKHVSDESESETDSKSINHRTIKKRQKHTVAKEETSTSTVKHPISEQPLDKQVDMSSEFVLINGQLLPVSTIKQGLINSFSNTLNNQIIPNIPTQLVFPQSQPAPISDALHVFIAENRTHNCEIRMNMMQLSSKLDQVLEKLAKEKTEPTQFVSQINRLDMESGDNYKKESNFVEERHKFLETIVSNEQTINTLKQQCEDQNRMILNYEENFKEFDQYKNTVEEQAKTIKNLEQIIAEQKADLKDLTKICEEHKEQLDNSVKLNEKIELLEKELLDKSTKTDLFSKKLKRSMNVLYQSIMENFDEESFQPSQKQILSHHLKTATFNIIQEFQNDFKSEVTVQGQSNKTSPPVPYS